MNYEVEIMPSALLDVEKHQKSGQNILLNNIGNFINEIKTTPKVGTGKPEELKGYGERSVWSRRIDQKHRLTYEIFEQEKIVKILTCFGYYEDK